VRCEVEKLTNESLLREACEFTMLRGTSNQTFEKMLELEHSPIRTQIYIVRLYDIPAFTAHHLRTHTIGVLGHFITSRRNDRGGEKNELRSEPVDHLFICNAEALINIAHARLCPVEVHEDTVAVVKMIIVEIEEPLKKHLIPNCEYRGNRCNKKKSCGRYENDRICQVY